MSNIATTNISPASIAAVNSYHSAAKNAANQAVAYAVLCGLELNKIKKEVGHGNFEATIEQNFPELGLRTAQRYAALAEGIKDKALKNDTVSFLKLIDSKPSELSGVQSEKLEKAVTKATDGKTLTQLYMEFGIVRKPHILAGGNHGGEYATGPRSKPSLHEQNAENQKLAREDFAFLQVSYEAGRFTALSDPEIEAQIGALETYAKVMRRWVGTPVKHRAERAAEILKALKS